MEVKIDFMVKINKYNCFVEDIDPFSQIPRLEI